MNCISKKFFTFFKTEYHLQSIFTLNEKCHLRRILYLALFANFANGILTYISPFVLFPALYFHLDPGYYLINEYVVQDAFSSRGVLIGIGVLVVRSIPFYLFVLVMCRCFCFIYLIEACRIYLYSYCLTLLRKLSRTKDFYFEYRSLRICHSMLCVYFNLFYLVFPTYCQVTIVGFLWLCIREVNLLPFVVWSFALIFAILLTVVVFATLSFSVGVHLLSDRCLQFWGRPFCLDNKNKNDGHHYRYRFHEPQSMYWKRVSKSQLPLRTMFGSYFVLDMDSIMKYLNLLLQNLANTNLVLHSQAM